jgi:type I restriction enzyme S subunit
VSAGVPPRYKQTEVGVIPEDWTSIELSQISAFITKGSTPTTYGFKWEKSGIPFLRSECVSETGLNLSQSMFISNKAHALLERSEVVVGDLLITITGNVGRVVINSSIEKANINQHIARVRITAPTVSKKYVQHYLSLPAYRKYFESITTGQAYPQISLKQVREAKISLPTFLEQQAIAEALSDADALIEGLEQLIAKKRQLKQGAMDELLSGKRRLKEINAGYKQTEVGEIPEDWGIAQLKQMILSLDAGVSVNSVENGDSPSNGAAVLKTSCVARGRFLPSESKPIAPKDLARARLRPKADTIIFSRMNTPDLVGECGYVPYNYSNLFLPDRLWMTKVGGEKSVNVQWLAYLLSSSTFNHKIKEAATGTSGSMKNISKGSLLSVAIPYPLETEQKAIAETLRDIDAEIVGLEGKLAKARRVKEGMMQDLLTGKVRLV